MLAYFSTERYSAEGVSFSPIYVGNYSSFGQRCVVLAGVKMKGQVTVGAETFLPFDFFAQVGSTAFGSPPVVFQSTALYKDIIDQSQSYAMNLLRSDHSKSDSQTDTLMKVRSEEKSQTKDI